jgi:type I restriction enzyme M protein
VGTYQVIEREDGYVLSEPADLSNDVGRTALAKTLARIGLELNRDTGVLEPIAAVNPTPLAEKTWQTIWLASGENPDACLAMFVEILLFKFLSGRQK